MITKHWKYLKKKRKRKITAEKSVWKPDNFEIVSPKGESKVTEKLVEEYSKDFESSEESQEVKGSDSTDGIGDTFKGIIRSIEEDLENLTSEIVSDRKIFLKSLTKLISILVIGKYISLEKIKKIVKIAIARAIKLWPEQKQL